MRHWLSIPLLIGVLAVTAPALARQGNGHTRGGHAHVGHAHNGVRSQGNVPPSFESTNSLAALELHEGLVSNGLSRDVGRRRSSTRGSSSDFGVLDGGWGGWSDWYGAPATSTSSRIVIIRERRPAAEERPTIETAPSGVEIVRGPGSRHLAP